MKDSPGSQTDTEQLVAEIREKIRKAREFVPDDEMGNAPDNGSAELALENLQKANERVRSLGYALAVAPPTPPTIRGRIGRMIIHILSKLLWWQQLRLADFASAAASRNDEAFRHLASLLRSVRELETAQIKLQSAQIDRLTVRDLMRVDERIEKIAHQLSHLSTQMQSQVDGLAEANQRMEAAVAQVSQGTQRVETEVAQIEQRTQSNLVEITAAIEALKTHTDKLRIADSQRASHEARLSALETELAQLRGLAPRLSGFGAFTYQTRAQTSLLDRRISLLIEETRKNRAGAPSKEQRRGAVDDHQFDAVYLAFEDVFRGTREEIKTRQAVYIPVLKENSIGVRDMPILDLGCGRGEWLELLRDHELNGRGVDRNETMLEECRNWGLDVTEGDAILYLQGLPANSLGAVTGFHIIEHLPFPALVALVDECLRVLKPGGMVIFETPNPGNFHVGVQNFYMDPTHVKPLPSAMIRFFVEARGFCDARILELHPYPESFLLPNDPYGIGQRLNSYLYGPQDYAVIGRKV